ncbi:oligosaccharide flippase family protein [Rhodoferax sp. U11-2br]|uniref:oligosaccharide flippase family protein n=1 Tax=Rhodoferax sp. U11-2br TaxID=2838878 RepID=UPI001BEB47BB|nr:oligosaccharide flippase family protein [Rhodoferax sp. U11-2br]
MTLASAALPPAVTPAVRATAARSLRWTLLESVGLSGLSFVALIFFSRYLSAGDFGIAAVAIGIVQLLTVPVEVLFHDALIRTREATPRHVNSAFAASLVIGIVLTLACWLLADHFAALIGQPDVGPVLRWMSLGLVASGCGSALVAMQRRRMQFRALALRSTIGRTGSAIIGIGLAVAGAGVWSLVAQQVGTPVLSTLALWLMTPDKPRFRLSRPELVEMTRFGAVATSFSLMALSTQRIFIIAVASFLGSQMAGILSLAFRAVDMLRDIVGGAVAQLALPIFASLKGSRSDIQHTFTVAVRLTTALMFPVFTGLAVCSHEVVELVFGARWLAAAPFVSLLSVLTFQFFLRLFSVPIYNATGHPALPTAALLPQIAFVLIGMLLFGRFSLEAAAAVWASRLVLGLSIDLWLLKRVTGMRAAVQLAGAVSPALAAAGMAAIVYGTRLGLLGQLDLVPRLAVMVSVGAIAYVGLLWLLNRSLVLELVGFARQTIARSQ